MAIKVVRINGIYHVEGRPRDKVKLLVHKHPSNIPGKSLLVLRIDKEPNGATPPHTHAGAAVLGLTISGHVLNQMNDEEAFTVGPGEMWYEAPGCHHVQCNNESETEPASFLAVLIVDDEVVRDGYEGVVVIDQAVEDAKSGV